MKQDFDFDKIGKRVPYRVPDGFFEEVQKNVMRQTVEKRVRKPLILRWTSVALAAAAVLTAVIFIPLRQQELSNNQMTQVSENGNDWIEDLTDEELQAMDDLSNYDIFMQ